DHCISIDWNLSYWTVTRMPRNEPFLTSKRSVLIYSRCWVWKLWKKGSDLVKLKLPFS
ncbi:hypothetical protein BGX21_009950, partial [Mortierella sp. AD011]